jgi:hypothetical protein
MFIMLSRGNTDDREPLIWHTTPGAFVFQTRIHRRFIPVSFVKHPSLNSFLGSLHLYSVISQVLTPPFGLRFVTHLFNRIPSHIICLSLCSYSAQSQSRLG